MTKVLVLYISWVLVGQICMLTLAFRHVMRLFRIESKNSKAFSALVEDSVELLRSMYEMPSSGIEKVRNMFVNMHMWPRSIADATEALDEVYNIIKSEYDSGIRVRGA